MNSLYPRKITPLNNLDSLCRDLQAQGKTIVQCHGCFDIVHPGHIRYLRFAKSLGDILVVTVSGDDVVMKGIQRPFIPEDLRLENLAELECVDFVALSPDSWAGPALEIVKPDVYVKGKEYESSSDARFAKEKALVEELGGRVVLGSGDVVFSSTALGAAARDFPDLNAQKVARYCRTHGITKTSLNDIVRKLRTKSFVVLGDVIVDEYIECEAPRVASEAPILSVQPVNHEFFVGGAALIARQLAALGASVSFVTAGKDDDTSRYTAQVLAELGVDVVRVDVPNRSSFTKTRYVVGLQKVFKVDRGAPQPLSLQSTSEIVRELEQRTQNMHALIATDFGYGLFNETLTSELETLCNKAEIPYFADVSSNNHTNILKFRGAQMATPTEDELRFSLGDGEAGLSNLASRYFERTNSQNLAVTMGRRGVVYFSSRKIGSRLRTNYLPALTPSRQDAVGAGDSFLAGAAAAHVAGASPEEGIYFASCLATVSTSRMGNSGAPLEDILRFIETRPELGQT